MDTKQDAKQLMREILKELMPEVLREQINNIRTGTIVEIDLASRMCTVQVNSTGIVLSNMRMTKGITDAVIGDTCVIVSDDPVLNSNNFIVGVI